MKHFTFFLFFFITYALQAQPIPKDTLAKTTIYAELGGSSVLYAVNADYIFWHRKYVRLSATAGFHLFPSRYPLVLSGTGAINLMIGKRKHFLEVGGGYGYVYAWDHGVSSTEWRITPDTAIFNSITGTERSWSLYGFAKIGYRYQRPQGGFFFKASFTPLFAVRSGEEPLKGSMFPKGYFKTSTKIFLDLDTSPFAWGGIGIGYTFKTRTKR